MCDDSHDSEIDVHENVEGLYDAEDSIKRCAASKLGSRVHDRTVRG